MTEFLNWKRFSGKAHGKKRTVRGAPTVIIQPGDPSPEIHLSSELVDALALPLHTVFMVNISEETKQIRLVRTNNIERTDQSTVISVKAGGGYKGLTKNGHWRQLISMKGVFGELGVSPTEAVVVNAQLSSGKSMITFSYEEALSQKEGMEE